MTHTTILQADVWVDWNDQQPAAPGFYWLYNPSAEAKGENPDIVQVMQAADGAVMLTMGVEVAYEITPGLVAYWCGPIEPPTKEVTLWRRK